jgi:CheY-like chemotaxis protein
MSYPIDILLVEDDPGDVRLAMAVLRAVDMAAHTAVVSDGQEALDFLCLRGRFSTRVPGHPALILLDLKMPRVDGFGLLGELKKDRELKLVPVVALTSSDEARDIERAYDLGVNGYVVKGISFADYGTMLQSLARYWVKVNERPQPAPRATLARSEAGPGAGGFTLPWLAFG